VAGLEALGALAADASQTDGTGADVSSRSSGAGSSRSARAPCFALGADARRVVLTAMTRWPDNAYVQTAAISMLHAALSRLGAEDAAAVRLEFAPTLIDTLKRHELSATVVEVGCELVATMVNGDEDNARVLAAANGAAVVLGLWRDAAGNAPVLASTSAALCALALDAEVHSWLCNAGCERDVLGAMGEHSESAHAVQVCTALGALALTARGLG
jgi:hypothetical protein